LVQEGRLLINGQTTNSPVTLAGGILGGIGTCGPITALSGQLSPGTTGPGSTAGTLNVSGDVTMTDQVSFVVDLFGLGYDQLNVTGAVNLGNANLSLNAFGLAPTNGTIFTIINNDGTDPIAGTFAGLPEGTAFTADSVGF